MVSSGLLRRVALVRTDVSEEPGASIIRVTRIGELGTTQAATSNRRTLRKNTLFHQQNADQNWDMKIANRLFETVSQFKYLRTTVTNRNLIQEEIMRTNSSNVRYH
jgi:hypothetical protein